MAGPFLLMVLLYLVLAVLAVLYISLVNFQLLPAFPNLRWLVVHLATLGAFTEFSFAALPFLTAARARRSQRQFEWETWLLLNTGLVLLFAGILWMNFLFLTTGGTGIFLAVLRLARELQAHRPVDSRSQGVLRHTRALAKISAPGGLKFYMAGLSFLLLGILVGTGLWQGWGIPLHIAIPKEVHVHANLWGFTALVFAGLLVDFAPRLTGQQLARPGREGLIFWLMSLGAAGLVLGPWLDINLVQVVGLEVHTAGSILLVGQVFWPVRKQWRWWSPGLWHILAAYFWFFLAVVVAPLVVLSRGVGTEVAGSGGPILIFGWILQFSYVLIPALLRSMTRSDLLLEPGGSRLSLAASNSGSLVYWISLFTPVFKSPLRGVAFLLWLIALLPFVVEILNEIKVVQKSVARLNSDLSR